MDAVAGRVHVALTQHLMRSGHPCKDWSGLTTMATACKFRPLSCCHVQRQRGHASFDANPATRIRRMCQQVKKRRWRRDALPSSADAVQSCDSRGADLPDSPKAMQYASSKSM